MKSVSVMVIVITIVIVFYSTLERSVIGNKILDIVQAIIQHIKVPTTYKYSSYYKSKSIKILRITIIPNKIFDTLLKPQQP
jgi:hypothetical protein